MRFPAIWASISGAAKVRLPDFGNLIATKRPCLDMNNFICVACPLPQLRAPCKYLYNVILVIFYHILGHQSLSLKNFNGHIVFEDNGLPLYSFTRYFKFQNITLKNNDYGIYAYSSNISIDNSVIANGNTAIYLYNSSQKTLAMLLVTNSEIYGHSGGGIWTDNQDLQDIELHSSVLTNNEHAFYLQRGVRDLKVTNVTLKDNRYGIVSYYVSGNISIDNCLITNGNIAVYLYQSTSNFQNVLVRNSVIYDHDSVVYFRNYYYYSYKQHSIKLEGCVLGRNDYVIRYDSSRQSTTVTLSNCILKENSRIMYLLSQYSHQQVNLVVSECSISRTKYEVLDLRSSEQSPITIKLSNNTFLANTHTVLRIRVTSRSSISIKKNVFVNNSLSTGDALIDFTGKGISTSFTKISENTFIENKCSFIVKVAAQSNRALGLFSFRNNILKDNKAAHFNPSNYFEVDVYSYSIGLLGCSFNHYSIQYNVFDNELMQKELFVGDTCSSNYMHGKFDVDAKFNYWGSSTFNLWRRIFHFADWNDRPKVKYLPAFATLNFTDVITSEISWNKSEIGGYIDSSLRLTTRYSPYVVITDLTIAENVTLEIEPGVKLYFKPNIGLLVLGNIIAQGTTRKEIKFCSAQSKCESRQQTIRLVGGDRENGGILEILVGGWWQDTCRSYFTSRVGEVACRQLGNGKYITHSSKFYGYYVSRYKVYFKCNGNETSLLHCKNQTKYCANQYRIYLQCEHSNRWGNIRIALPKHFNSSDYGLVSEQSSLRNIFIHGAGYLHDQGVSSIQVIERSLPITHVSIIQSQGITIIGQRDTMALKDINVENNLGFPSIAILGNKGTVSISQASIRKGNHNGIAIAPIKHMRALMRSYPGQHDLCDQVQKIYIDGSSYVFLNQKSWIQDVICSLEILSPNNTMIHIRLLFWARNSYTIRIKYGSHYSNIYDWNYYQHLDRVIVIPLNTFIVEAEISHLREFLAEITVVNKPGKE